MVLGPMVGIGVLLFREGKVLLGKRIGAHGAGTWSPPGGHLEFGESWEECGRRETEEETGLVPGKLEFLTATNDIFPKKHYVTIFLVGEAPMGEPRVREPDKCAAWEWFDWDDLPPLFLPFEKLRNTWQAN